METGWCVVDAFSCLSLSELGEERPGAHGRPAGIPGPASLSVSFTKAPAPGLSCAHHSGFKAAPKVEGQLAKIKT